MASGFSTIGKGAAAGHTAVENAKSYIRIGDLAREFDVTLRTLRFYEDKGLLQPKREGITRLYTELDRVRLGVVLRGRKIGFPLRDMKQILELYSANGTDIQQLRVFLRKSEKQMEWLEKQYAEIEEAVGELTQFIAEIRARLSHLTEEQQQQQEQEQQQQPQQGQQARQTPNRFTRS